MRVAVVPRHPVASRDKAMPTELRVVGNRLPLVDLLLGVQSWSGEVQDQHRLTIGEGRFYFKGELLTTKGNRDIAPPLSGEADDEPFDRAIFVFTPKGIISSGNEDIGFLGWRRFWSVPLWPKVTKHSTLAGGVLRPLASAEDRAARCEGLAASAGEMKLKDGRLKELILKSGHYSRGTTGNSLHHQLFEYLKKSGVDLGGCLVRVNRFEPENGGDTTGHARIRAAGGGSLPAEARQIRNELVERLGGVLKLGPFEELTTTEEGQPVFHFEHGRVVTDPTTGKVEMVVTAAGAVPGEVLAQAARKGLGGVHSIAVDRLSTVSYRFFAPVVGRVGGALGRTPRSGWEGADLLRLFPPELYAPIQRFSKNPRDISLGEEAARYGVDVSDLGLTRATSAFDEV